jgi:UDP-N-acetylglucosamine 3-dehydrogenase
MRDPVRLGIIGLGAMGRNHARVASRIQGIELVGGVDPAGDPERAMAYRPVFPTIDGLLEAGIDAVVVAVPNELHEEIAIRAADEGIHTLIEKPLGPDAKAAMRIRDAFAGTGLTTTIGHVERYNPALQEMKRRLDAKAIGRMISIRTVRVGPYPFRMRDVGVVKDLATHDIDLILWLGGTLQSLETHLARKLGDHEDLLEAIGVLVSGPVVSMSVNWLTPSKQRSITILGEKGALHADLLSADLTFFANADHPTEWDEMARLKGVSEGNVIRYALRKREPLQVEVEAFRDSILGEKLTPGTADVELVTLDEGIEVLRVADMILGEGRYRA